jgi:hypothetical protein
MLTTPNTRMPKAPASRLGLFCVHGVAMGSGLIDLDTISYLSEIPRSTWRTWQRRDKIHPVACSVGSRQYLFCVNELDAQAKKRRKRAA